MTSPNTCSPPQACVRAEWTHQRTAWLLFAPPAVLVGLRWLLQLFTDRQPGPPALALLPVATPSGLLDLLWPMAVALGLLAASALLISRLGWHRVMPVAAGLWLLLWLGGSAALLQRQLNEQGLFLRGVTVSGSASVTVRVLASQLKPPSLRGVGGTELVLQVPGLDAPQRLLIDEPQAVPIKSGDMLALQLARGRFTGLFVTDWQRAPHGLATPVAPAASP
jgi:hypothetical protein